jgi:Zinc-finger of C2H2 type
MAELSKEARNKLKYKKYKSKPEVKENNTFHIAKTQAKNRDKYKCEPCNVSFVCQSHYNEHLLTKKHEKCINPPPIVNKERYCECCNKSFFGKYYDSHLLSVVHDKKANPDKYKKGPVGRPKKNALNPEEVINDEKVT